MNKKRFSFRKGPAYSGNMSLPSTYCLNYGGVQLATLQELRRNTGLWFWYGDGQNTCHEPTSLEECKKHVLEHFKKKYE